MKLAGKELSRLKRGWIITQSRHVRVPAARAAFSKEEPKSEQERSIEITLSPQILNLQMAKVSSINCKDSDKMQCGKESTITMRKCDTSLDIATKITTLLQPCKTAPSLLLLTPRVNEQKCRRRMTYFPGTKRGKRMGWGMTR